MFFVSGNKIYLQKSETNYVGVEIYSDKVLELEGVSKRKLDDTFKHMTLAVIKLKFSVTKEKPYIFEVPKKRKPKKVTEVKEG